MAFSIKDVYLNEHAISDPQYDTLNGFISAVLPNVYTVAGVLLLIYAVVGGFMLIASAGAESTGQGKQIVTNAIIGFIIIFASYWIIQIIEIMTGLSILN